MEEQERELVVIGTCHLMCSERETLLRQKRDLIHPLEFKDGSKLPDKYKMVKEYSRPAAGKSDPAPSELRPGPVLLITTKYLIHKIIPWERHPWHYVYEFVFDRLRAVRQDMTIQRIRDNHAIWILERALRIMIYAHYRLCEAPPAQFDAKINATHIQECLKRLLCLYEPPLAPDAAADRRGLTTTTTSCRCHRADFVAAYLLFNLGSSEALNYGLQRKADLGKSSSFSLALKLSLAWWRRNYVRVFRLVKMLPALQMCAFNNVRHNVIREAVSIMSCGYNSKNLSYPLSSFVEHLDLGSGDVAKDVCDRCGLTLTSSGSIRLLKTSFKPDSVVTAMRSQRVDEDLSWEDLSQLLDGSPCSCPPGHVT